MIRSRRSEAERDALLAEQQATAPPTVAAGKMLLDFKGIGPEFAAVLWLEAFFRHFDNRRQLASYAGLAPTPWQSGSVDREQGVSKAGNPRLRTTLIQLAWLWLRHQPQVGTGPVVQRTGQPQRRPHEKDDHRGAWRESCWWRCGNMSPLASSSREH